MTRTVSVVINTYNRAESLERTLGALEALDHPSFEVVVVDGPSTDGTADVLARWAGRIKVGSCPERNLSMSRNVGIALAAGELVAFIDDDAYPDPGWLDAVAAAFDDEEVAAAGGPVWDHTGAVLQARFSLADRTGHAWTSEGPDPSRVLANPFGDAFVYPIGTNAVFRRDRLVAIGGFDEEFEYYLDETDVCRRLVDRGWIVAALERGEVFHKFLPSDVRTPQRAIRDRYAVLKNRAYFALKHRGAHYSVADAWHAFWLFANHHEHDMQANIDDGLLVPDDLATLRLDVPRAAEAAEAAAEAPGARQRPSAWFDEHPAAFVPFPTALPDGSRLHVCFLSAEYAPAQLNGIARVVKTLAEGLAARGHVVRVLTQGQDHDRVDLEDGVWVHRLAPRPGPEGDARDSWAPSWDFSSAALEALDEIALRRSVDVVQVPNWDAEGLAVLRTGRYRCVMGLYTPLATVAAVDDRFAGDVPWLAGRLATEREGYGLASAFLACGPAIVDEIESRYGLSIPRDRLGLVPHGLPGPEGADLPDEAGPRDDRPNVLFVGRLEPRKGIDTFLAAVPEVALRCPGATFTVIGDDRIPTARGRTYREEFEDSPWGWMAGDRLHFAGLVDDDERTRAYAACDVFVAPSRYESFGLILLEAMMFAKPCIAADIGGMSEIVEPGVTGLLVPPGDAPALGAAIARLVEDSELRRAMGRAGRARFEERYAAARMAEGVEAYYREVTASVPPGPRRAMATSRAEGAGGRMASLGSPLDMATVSRCTACGGRVRAVDRVVTADGHRKDGTLVCDACSSVVAEVGWFHTDFFAAGGGLPAPGETRTVPALGERRLAPDDPEVQLLGRWGTGPIGAWAEGDAGDALVVEAVCTDVGVRLLCHPGAGLADLWLDGVRVDTVDLHQAEGSVAVFAPVGENLALARHRAEVRPAAARGVAPHAGTQVVVQEVVLLGPLAPATGFGPPVPINRGNPYSERIEAYIDAVPAGGRILEVGGGDRRRSQPDMVNFEFLRFELADAYGDLHTLPFADGAFDLVVTQAVFEHLSNPFVAAQELIRVTRPGGLVVTEVAFLQPLHAVPYHYFNMTLWGVEELFAGCDVVERDWFGGLTETVGWILESAGVPAHLGAERWGSMQRDLRAADALVDHAALKAVASGVFLVVRTPAQDRSEITAAS